MELKSMIFLFHGFSLLLISKLIPFLIRVIHLKKTILI